jgi:hypothetical protein
VALAALPGVGDTARDDPWQRLMKDLRGAGYVPHFSSEIVPEETDRQKESGNGHKADTTAQGSNGMTAHSNGTSEGQTAGTTKRRKSSSRTSA